MRFLRMITANGLITEQKLRVVRAVCGRSLLCDVLVEGYLGDLEEFTQLGEARNVLRLHLLESIYTNKDLGVARHCVFTRKAEDKLSLELMRTSNSWVLAA